MVRGLVDSFSLAFSLDRSGAQAFGRWAQDSGGHTRPYLSWLQGMIALRRGATELTHEDYMEGILEVQAKKKANLQYYA